MIRLVFNLTASAVHTTTTSHTLPTPPPPSQVHVLLSLWKDEDDPLLKFPIDEAWLPPPVDLPPFPALESAMCVPPSHVGPFVVLWDFVAAFSRKIEVSPFTLEDLEASACHR